MTTMRGTPFAVIPEWVLYHPDLSDGAKVLYGALQRHVGSTGTAWPGQERLATLLNCSVRTIKARTAELEQAGAIRKQRRFRSTTIYTLVADSPKRGKILPHKDVQDSAPQRGEILPDRTRATEREKNPPTPQRGDESEGYARKARRQDLCDAVMRECRIRSKDVTRSQQRAIDRCAEQLDAVAANPSEVRRRAREFRMRWPNITLTPAGLARHWAGLAPADAVVSEVHNPTCPICDGCGMVETERGWITCQPSP